MYINDTVLILFIWLRTENKVKIRKEVWELWGAEGHKHWYSIENWERWWDDATQKSILIRIERKLQRELINKTLARKYV